MKEARRALTLCYAAAAGPLLLRRRVARCLWFGQYENSACFPGQSRREILPSLMALSQHPDGELVDLLYTPTGDPALLTDFLPQLFDHVTAKSSTGFIAVDPSS